MRTILAELGLCVDEETRAVVGVVVTREQFLNEISLNQNASSQQVGAVLHVFTVFLAIAR